MVTTRKAASATARPVVSDARARSTNGADVTAIEVTAAVEAAALAADGIAIGTVTAVRVGSARAAANASRASANQKRRQVMASSARGDRVEKAAAIAHVARRQGDGLPCATRPQKSDTDHRGGLHRARGAGHDDRTRPVPRH